MRRLEFFKNIRMETWSRWSCQGGPWEWSDEEDKKITSNCGRVREFLANSCNEDNLGTISNDCCERKLECLGQEHSFWSLECWCWCSQWRLDFSNFWWSSIDAFSAEASACFSKQQQNVMTQKKGLSSKTLIIFWCTLFIGDSFTLKYLLVKVKDDHTTRPSAVQIKSNRIFSFAVGPVYLAAFFSAVRFVAQVQSFFPVAAQSKSLRWCRHKYTEASHE